MKTKFNIGDNVVALSSGKCPSQPRTKGEIYTITNELYCSTTGDQLVNINNTKSCNKTLYIQCGCGKRHKKDSHYAFTYATEFALLEDLDELVNMYVEEERYEEAHELTLIQEQFIDD